MKSTLPITADELCEIANNAYSSSPSRIHRLVAEIWRLRAKVRTAKAAPNAALGTAVLALTRIRKLSSGGHDHVIESIAYGALKTLGADDPDFNTCDSRNDDERRATPAGEEGGERDGK